MRHFLFSLILAASAIGTTSNAQDPGATTGFEPENAILDTAIPFAIGAREARQDLRGSFGWPTFQEGLVEGVYFRFDPDGYARFAPAPRLDTDVFEVLCRPATTNCQGRKGDLIVFLNTQGALQLEVQDYRASDQIFVSEGLTEIELPPTVMMPLDARLESLLSVGGDLVIRRGDIEKSRVSLTGFGAVTTYLRWVASRQNPTSFPRGWPVPGDTAPSTNRFESSTWDPTVLRNQSAPIIQREQAAAAPEQSDDTSNVERDLLALAQALNVQTAPNTATLPQVWAQPPVTAAPLQENGEVAALQQQVQTLLAEIARLQTKPTFHTQQSETWPIPQQKPAPPPVSNPEHLSYLVEELGMNVADAIDILNRRDNRQSGAAIPDLGTQVSEILPNRPRQSTQAARSSFSVRTQTSRDALVEDILNELIAELPEEDPPEPSVDRADDQISGASVSNETTEFELLSDYLRSVFEQQRDN